MRISLPDGVALDLRLFFKSDSTGNVFEFTFGVVDVAALCDEDLVKMVADIGQSVNDDLDGDYRPMTDAEIRSYVHTKHDEEEVA